MNKKFVITGVNGQLGQFLVKYLQENQPNIEIIGTLRHKSYDNQPYIFNKSKITFELMDLSDPHSIESLIVKYKPDYMVNTAANAFVGESWSLPIQQFEINTLGVLHQLEGIRKHSPYTRYFNMGTSEEFANDINDGKSQNEDTKIDPKSPYGCSKAAARYLINTYRNSYNLYALQGWTFNFESELRGIKYVTKKITTGVARINYAIKNKLPFEPIELGNINSYRSWQFVGDVADGIWRQLNQELYWNNKGDWNYIISRIKPYVISSSQCNNIKTFVELAFSAAKIEGYWNGEGLNQKYLLPNNILDISELKSYVLVKVNPNFFRLQDVTYLNGDASRIQAELGWKSTTSLKDLVFRMVNYDITNYEKSL